MSIPLTLYLIHLLEAARTLAEIAAVLAGIAAIASGFIMAGPLQLDRDEEPKAWDALAKALKVSAILAAVFMVLIVLIPDRNTMYLMVAGSFTEHIIQLEEVQSLGTEASELAKTAIEALKAHLQPVS